MKSIITLQGLDLLKIRLTEKREKLKELQAEKAHAYTASGDGWHDNPGWTQLGQQEELLSKEIILLEHKISNAVLLDPNTIQTGKVQIGCKVTYRLRNVTTNNETENSIFIVGIGETDLKQRRVSYDSPIGKALYSLEIGQENNVTLPNGQFTIKVLEVSYE